MGLHAHVRLGERSALCAVPGSRAGAGVEDQMWTCGCGDREGEHDRAVLGSQGGRGEGPRAHKWK